MRSPLELLSGGDASSPSGPPPEDVLRSVKAEGVRRRGGRRRRNLAVALVGLAVLAVPAVALRPDSGGRDDEVAVAAGGGSEIVPDSTEPSLLDPVGPAVLPGDPATSAPTLPAPAAGEPAATTAPPPAGAPATTAAPAPAAASTTAPATTGRPCRNSEDPACGDFRWDPAPAPNQPLVASFTKAPATALAGQPVAFEVTWSDADAGLTFERFSTDGTAVGSACALAPRHGPWTPPAATAGSGTLPYTTSFANPGTYMVTVTLATADCTSPYADEKLLETSITVEPAVATG